MPTKNQNKITLLSTISSIISSAPTIKNMVKKCAKELQSTLKTPAIYIGLIDPQNSIFFTDLDPSFFEKAETEFKLELATITESTATANQSNIIEKVSSSHHQSMTGLISLPMWMGQEKLGAFSILIPYRSLEEFYSTLSFFQTVILLMSQKIMLTRTKTSDQMALLQENLKLKHELQSKYNIHNMVGQSNEMKRVYESIMQVANTTTSVLIRGESGTGKELVAHAIHYTSNRAAKPFVPINCGAIPEGLIESELFGYEKGAFTDATQKKIGKFQAAEGGTLVLDEISELAPNLQVKLLRVLQEREFTPVGGILSIKTNVRIIAASNKDLEREVQEGRFREDLYYRLNVFPIFMPPLRERKSDILLLANHFLEKYAKETQKPINRISSMAIDWLSRYHWPGNVRELENAIERSVIICDGDAILAEHLPPTLQVKKPDSDFKQELSLEEMTHLFEKNLIIDALRKHNGNQSKTAAYLKTSNRILGYKIKNLNINPKGLDDM
jgi:Nif-specific regulatory protein